jgi:phytoene dehydrogenase-like protein
MSDTSNENAIVVGSGPNGLAAAITLAEAGIPVTVYERNKIIGGGCRSIELIKPGYIHDINSAIHPMAMISPFFRRIPLEDYGLSWLIPQVAMAHPFDDGTAVLLTNSINDTAATLDKVDNKAYSSLMNPLVNRWQDLTEEIMFFPNLFTRHPFTMLRFGTRAIHSVAGLARSYFKGNRARAVFAGMGAHSVMRLESTGSAAVGLVLAAIAHVAGWPIAIGGARSITDAMAKYLTGINGKIVTDNDIESIENLPPHKLLLLDITPGQFLKMAEKQLPERDKKRLGRYKYGPGVFKIDWLLDGEIPWKAPECLMAGTVHIGGSLEEIIDAERAVFQGQHPEKPFIMLAQPSLFDKTRANGTEHIVWGYCHVPNGSSFDMTERIEGQIERFAPGFKDRITARSVMYPMDVEKDNPNCVGGDVAGGMQSFRRMILPAVSYNTPLKNVYLCSSSTPPGPGVHGMCGYRAAKLALNRL